MSDCEVVDGGAFVTIYKYCRTHKCEPKECPVQAKKETCVHDWLLNEDKCKKCGMTGLDLLEALQQTILLETYK